jgi:hypothetical protein
VVFVEADVAHGWGPGPDDEAYPLGQRQDLGGVGRGKPDVSITSAIPMPLSFGSLARGRCESVVRGSH